MNTAASGDGSPCPAPKQMTPGVLQEPPDDALDGDVLREPGDPRPQTAHSTNYQRDRHAGLRRRVQRFDHIGIDQRIQLCPNSGGAARLCMRDLGGDEFEQLCPDPVG